MTEVRRFSNSEIQTFKDCRRRWYLAWYRGLRWRTESPVEVRHTGDRIHRALMTWYVPDGVERIDPRESLETAIQEDLSALLDVLTAAGRDPDTDADRVKFDKASILERIMIDGYMEWLAETGEDAYLEVIAPETYLEVPLDIDAIDGQEVRLIGKIDVRVRRTTSGARLFIDHKTVAVMVPYPELTRNEQMMHYHLLEAMTSDEGRCDGALYNQLRRVKRTSRANPPFYDRTLVTHNDHTLHSFKERTTAVVYDILQVQHWLDNGADHRSIAYPRPSRDCSWKCPFSTACTMFDDGSRVEDFLHAYYVVQDPLSYYATSGDDPEMI